MLRNRKTEEADKLLGVDLAGQDTDLKLGTFQRLENWVPSELFALKKKRGVAALETADTNTITTIDCIVEEEE